MAQEHDSKPMVIGIYGLPGSGKSTLLRHLQEELREEVYEKRFAFFEGSDKLAELCPGGLEAFKGLDEVERNGYRDEAIRLIQSECAEKNCGGITRTVWTSEDAEVFTHILYLDVPAEEIARRRSKDTERTDRDALSTAIIEAWKQSEEEQLRQICWEQGILFSLVRDPMLDRVLERLRGFVSHDENTNRRKLNARVDQITRSYDSETQTVLLIDADKTIAPVDSGKIFWCGNSPAVKDPSVPLFRSCGYSYYSFRQAALLYEDSFDESDFERHCEIASQSISLYPEFLELLGRGSQDKCPRMIIVTCGLSRVWSLVLEREGVADKIEIIGASPLKDRVVITPEGKRHIAARLQDKHRLYVRAFGDSPVDLPMLQQADDAIVVVGPQSMRSVSMEERLHNSIVEHGLRARQMVLPTDSSMSIRLTAEMLPVVSMEELASQEIYLTNPGRLRVIDATNSTASKIFATKMRDARKFGHELRDEHFDAGYWLAMTHVGEVIGREQFSIPHVFGNPTSGYRLRHEARTTIVACMRGGEPMAFGVSKAFPTARFLHTNEASDIQSHHLAGQSCVIIVDSVINEGTTIVKFVDRIRKIHRSICIVVVTGVAQAASIRDDGAIARSLDRRGNLTLIALRVSSNKYTGSGGTDTGNRLFNTTYQKKPEKEPERLMLQRSIS